MDDFMMETVVSDRDEVLRLVGAAMDEGAEKVMVRTLFDGIAGERFAVSWALK